MKMKLYQVINKYKELYNVSNVRNNKVLYNISKNKKILMDEIETYNKQADEISDKYVEKDENGNNKTVIKVDEFNGNKERILKFKFKEDGKTTYEKEYLDEMNELRDVEVDLPIRTIKFDDLEKDEGKLTPMEMDAIFFMIEE